MQMVIKFLRILKRIELLQKKMCAQTPAISNDNSIRPILREVKYVEK